MEDTINVSVSKTALICAVKPEGETKFYASEERRISSLISGYIKRKFPLRVYKTEKKGEILIVRRLLDLIEE